MKFLTRVISRVFVLCREYLCTRVGIPILRPEEEDRILRPDQSNSLDYIINNLSLTLFLLSRNRKIILNHLVRQYSDGIFCRLGFVQPWCVHSSEVNQCSISPLFYRVMKEEKSCNVFATSEKWSSN